MERPYIICHMGATVDGRIISAQWGDPETQQHFRTFYEQCHNTFNSQAWMVGRVTMEKDFTGGKVPELSKPARVIAREAFVADPHATSFAIAVDPGGKLGWDRNEIDGDHIIEILTERVPDEYLDYLQRQGISYLFAGTERIDFHLALEQLTALFPIKTLMLEGGGHINGSLLNEGLIDELSLLLLPVADGTPGTTTLFEVGQHLPKRPASRLRLEQVREAGHGVVWLRYKFEH